MPQEYIEVRGARENNLKNVSLQLPKRKITIFTGVSGLRETFRVLEMLILSMEDMRRAGWSRA